MWWAELAVDDLWSESNCECDELSWLLTTYDQRVIVIVMSWAGCWMLTVAVSLCASSATTHGMRMTRHCLSVGWFQWSATVSSTVCAWWWYLSCYVIQVLHTYDTAAHCIHTCPHVLAHVCLCVWLKPVCSVIYWLSQWPCWAGDVYDVCMDERWV